MVSIMYMVSFFASASASSWASCSGDFSLVSLRAAASGDCEGKIRSMTFSTCDNMPISRYSHKIKKREMEN